jgi:hypothetical protein
MAIKNEFSAYNFEKNISGGESLIVSHFILVMLGKLLRKAKKL